MNGSSIFFSLSPSLFSCHSRNPFTPLSPTRFTGTRVTKNLPWSWLTNLFDERRDSSPLHEVHCSRRKETQTRTETHTHMHTFSFFLPARATFQHKDLASRRWHRNLFSQTNSIEPSDAVNAQLKYALHNELNYRYHRCNWCSWCKWRERHLLSCCINFQSLAFADHFRETFARWCVSILV